MVILKSNNNIFGGYADSAWMLNGLICGGSSFLFTLTNPNNIPPTKYPPTLFGFGSAPPLFAQAFNFNSPHYGPTFGNSSSYDLAFLSQSNRGLCSFQFPKAYRDTTGYGYNTFTGSAQCYVDEIEVFKM